MQTLRLAVLTLVLLALAAVSAHAQVVAGSSFFFDHDGLDTTKYQLCVDATATNVEAVCLDVPTARVGTSNSYTFTLPAWVAKGNRRFAVRAVGDAGVSDLSNELGLRVIGKPSPATNLRTTQD